MKPINIYKLHKRMTSHLFPPFSSADERFLALALAGEAGELANIVKKRWRDSVEMTENARDEIADIRVYLELLAKCFGIEGNKLEKRVQKKLAIVVERERQRHPDERKPGIFQRIKYARGESDESDNNIPRARTLGIKRKKTKDAARVARRASRR